MEHPIKSKWRVVRYSSSLPDGQAIAVCDSPENAYQIMIAIVHHENPEADNHYEIREELDTRVSSPFGSLPVIGNNPDSDYLIVRGSNIGLVVGFAKTWVGATGMVNSWNNRINSIPPPAHYMAIAIHPNVREAFDRDPIRGKD